MTELAAELGITARAIRFYEDKGLIIPARAGSTRVYSFRERARMRLILRGKSLGFSLREIKDFLDLYNADPMHRTQREALLGAVRDRIGKLERMRVAIARTLEELQAIEHQTAAELATVRAASPARSDAASPRSAATRRRQAAATPR